MKSSIVAAYAVALASCFVASGLRAQAQPAVAPTSPPQADRTHWGLLLDIVDEPRVDLLIDSPIWIGFTPTVITFAWEVPGQVMSSSYTLPDGQPRKLSTLRWDEARHGLVETATDGAAEIVMLPQPDGSFVATAGKIHITYRMLDSGALERVWEFDRGAGLEPMMRLHAVKATAESIAAAQRQVEVWKQIHDAKAMSAAVASQLQAASAPGAAALATAVTTPAGPPYLGFRGLERFVGKRLFSPPDRMYIELQHGSGATLLISMTRFNGEPYGRYVLAESRERPGALVMLSSVVDIDNLGMTAEWKSDNVLSLSSRSDRQGNWVHDLELSAEGEALSYRRHEYRVGPIAGESRVSGTYVTPTPELLAAAAQEEARVKAYEEAAIAAAMASVVCDGSGVIGVDENGEDCATDGEWDANEDRAHADAMRGDYGQAADSPMKGIYDALVEANAEADAQLAQTQASYDATMDQARRQAANERAQAEGADDDAAQRARDLANAQEATRRQYEIAREYEAKRQAQAQAGAEAQAAAQAAQQQQAARTTSSSSSSSESVMGFNAATCAEGRAAAQEWVGSGGTFQVKSEVVQPDGRCVVQIHDWHSSGGASRQ